MQKWEKRQAAARRAANKKSAQVLKTWVKKYGVPKTLWAIDELETEMSVCAYVAATSKLGQSCGNCHHNAVKRAFYGLHKSGKWTF
jgi:hypothetical protein